MQARLYYLSITLLFALPTSIAALGDKVPFSLLRRLLPHNPVILEAGAQFGEDTAWMSEMWPNGMLYAVEPNPDAYPLLAQNSAKYSNVTIEQVAFSNAVGQFPFYQAGGASSLLKPTNTINELYFHADLEHPVIVPVTTLDIWTREHGIEHIDFMWLDMEGNELNALKGALTILPTVKVIYTEVNLQKFWEGCVMYNELALWLEQQGFEKAWEDIVPNWHGNVVFVNTRS